MNTKHAILVFPFRYDEPRPVIADGAGFIVCGQWAMA